MLCRDLNGKAILKRGIKKKKKRGRRRRGHQWMRWLDGITDAMNMNVGKLREMVRERESGVRGVTKNGTRLGD